MLHPSIQAQNVQRAALQQSPGCPCLLQIPGKTSSHHWQLPDNIQHLHSAFCNLSLASHDFNSIDMHVQRCLPCLTCRYHVSYRRLTRLIVPCCAASAAYSGDGILHTLPGAAVVCAAPPQLCQLPVLLAGPHAHAGLALPCSVSSPPCPALPCPALPCPSLPCPALPCPSLPCSVPPCPALPCPALSCLALPCCLLLLLPWTHLQCCLASLMQNESSCCCIRTVVTSLSYNVALLWPATATFSTLLRFRLLQCCFAWLKSSICEHGHLSQAGPAAYISNADKSWKSCIS